MKNPKPWQLKELEKKCLRFDMKFATQLHIYLLVGLYELH